MNFVERGLEFGCRVVAQARDKFCQHRGAGVAFDGDDEGETETGAVGTVQRIELGEFGIGKPVEPKNL